MRCQGLVPRENKNATERTKHVFFYLKTCTDQTGSPCHQSNRPDGHLVLHGLLLGERNAVGPRCQQLGADQFQGDEQAILRLGRQRRRWVGLEGAQDGLAEVGRRVGRRINKRTQLQQLGQVP